MSVGSLAFDPTKAKEIDMIKNNDATIERIATVLPCKGTATIFLRGGSTVFMALILARRILGRDVEVLVSTWGTWDGDAAAAASAGVR